MRRTVVEKACREEQFSRKGVWWKAAKVHFLGMEYKESAKITCQGLMLSQGLAYFFMQRLATLCAFPNAELNFKSRSLAHKIRPF